MADGSRFPMTHHDPKIAELPLHMRQASGSTLVHRGTLDTVSGKPFPSRRKGALDRQNLDDGSTGNR